MNIIKRMFLPMLLVLTSVAMPAYALRVPPAGYYTPQKVVYHINYDESDRQLHAMKNIHHQIDAVGQKNVDIRVVIHGKGISLLQRANTDKAFKDRVDELRSKGVRFLVCANTLKGKNIARESLYKVPEDDVVPSGIAEVVRLQGMGFAYVKP